jgi:hypothetical protein
MGTQKGPTSGGLNNAAAHEDPVLNDIVQRLAAAYQPLRVYLFGSKARCDHGPGSVRPHALCIGYGSSGAARAAVSPMRYSGTRAQPPTSWFGRRGRFGEPPACESFSAEYLHPRGEIAACSLTPTWLAETRAWLHKASKDFGNSGF